MAVGMPGTGLGGVFYFTMAAAMPIVQLYRKLTGSRDGSWRSVMVHLSLLMCIFLVMWAEALVIKWVLLGLQYALPAESFVHQTVDSAANQLAPALAVLPFIILGVVLGGLELLRVELNWWAQCRAQRQLQPQVLSVPLAA